MRYSDVTPKEIYLNRRRFLGSAMLAALARPIPAAAARLAASKTAFNAGGEMITPQKITTTYNNNIFTSIKGSVTYRARSNSFAFIFFFTFYF